MGDSAEKKTIRLYSLIMSIRSIRFDETRGLQSGDPDSRSLKNPKSWDCPRSNLGIFWIEKLIIA